jgi:hypothetical protein
MVSQSWLRSGGEMLLKITFVLLIAWLLGVLGLYRMGELVDVLLLVGLMLLLLGALKARGAAAAWKGCRLRQVMTTRSNSVNGRRSVP